ncbi:hypothetical protein Isop_1228 [Isosphaera pallida ATCC 43644]|uniref:Uncharacterized protein n=1 Tax=Isosphaera pallida (strain ATCC 43644 / DSM 9630 / IS1B) TaxID=575540 RepID=E8R6B3_ISOPI|nr:hypothetical protein Isop_1228 [Isosphaera pallida ATCC 43644]
MVKTTSWAERAKSTTSRMEARGGLEKRPRRSWKPGRGGNELEVRQLLSNLPVTTATYLHGPGGSLARAVDIAPDSTIVYAGILAGENLGTTPVNLLGGGDAVVVRLDATGQTVQSLTRIGNVVNDMEVSASNGRIAVGGNFGVAVLAPDGGSVVWSSATPANPSRVSIARNGEVAVLASKTISVFTPTGAPAGSWTLTDTSVTDVAIDSVTQSVFVSGYQQVSPILKTPFVRAYAYDGTFKWRAYDWTNAELTAQNLMADSEAYRVQIGRDDNLYMLASTDGGNNPFARDPQNLTTPMGSRNVGFDNYNRPIALSGSSRLAYYVRLNPATGEALRGQFLLARLAADGSGRQNTIGVSNGSIAADQTGRVIVSGQAFARIAARDVQQIAATTVGPYTGGEGFVMVASANFNAREVYTVFGGATGGNGNAPAAAISNGVHAVVLQNTSGSLITHQALQSSATTPAAYLAAWGGTSTPAPGAIAVVSTGVVEGWPGTALAPTEMARFSDGTNPNPAEYTATIDWKDGHGPQLATVALVGGQLAVRGASTYNLGGRYEPTVRITHTPTNRTATAHGVARIARDINAVTNRGRSAILFNRASRQYLTTAQIVNQGSIALTGRVRIALENLPVGVALANRSGTTPNGHPFVEVSLTSPWGIGQTLNASLRFLNPQLRPITFAMRVFHLAD